MFFHVSLLIAFVVLSHSATEEKTSLLLVQTLFRHGDRAPVKLYPTDPNGVDCWPNGLGKLTQLGKEQQYQLGKFLRCMYGGFVTSDPNEVYVNSSSADRCLNSAAAQLASFYAPEGKWKIGNGLNWQPIPVHYLPPEMDIYLSGKSKCPRLEVPDASARQYTKSKIQEFYRRHQALVKNVSNYSGLNISDSLDVLYLFDTLEVERVHNLIIPEWAQTYWNEMKAIADESFQAIFTSPLKLRLRMGPFLGLITDNMKNKINGRTPNLKFVINSSHDAKIAGILRALNFTNMPRPPYCATLLFELHEMADASMAVRLLYMNSTDPLVHMEKPHVLILEGCSEFCQVEYFMESYKWLIPDNWAEECEVDTSHT